jgi:beta-glucanase (GH16 family)
MVPPTITTAPTTPAVGPSGERMPVGDLPGWKQVFTDDFTTDVARGGFPGPYASKWTQYHGFYDTFKTGYYDKGAISTAGGAMDLFLRTENGKAIAAAPVPIVTKAWEGQTYGRFTVRFRSDSMPGYKTAWLLWPDTNNWNEGEIDFPEGGLDSTMMGFNHCVGAPSKNCSWWDTKKKFSDGWHTATIEWAPNKLTFILDGISSTTTTSVPATPMHWVLQTETNGKLPPTTTAGHLQIDWVSVYTYAP